MHMFLKNIKVGDYIDSLLVWSSKK